MATSSNSTAIHGFFIYGVFLEDLEYFKCKVPMRKSSGDIVQAKRTATDNPEYGIVLGCGMTKEQAKAEANNYMVQVGRWHKVEDPHTLELGETQFY